VTYARVTVQTVWDPADGTHDLQNGLWFANTNIYAGGYGGAATYAPLPNTVPLKNRFSSPGVLADVLSDNFGDFEVVSFGPNLGRDFAYGFAFQNVTVLDHTFVFSEHAPAAPTTPPSSTGGTTPAPTSQGTTSDQLTTFALPVATPTPTPSPSESDVPTPPSDDADDADDDGEVVVADPPKDAEAFPFWIFILSGGLVLLLLAFIYWLLRRRTA
jgi:hypothetical protein